MRAHLLIALTALLVAGAAAAGTGKMYKWTDENGVVHFSEAPPASQSTDSEQVAIPGVDTRAAERRRYAGQATDDDQAEEETDEKDKLAATLAEDPAAAAQLKQNCDNVRRNIAVLQSQYSRVQSYDEQGNPRELDAAQRSARLQSERAYIQTYCS